MPVGAEPAAGYLALLTGHAQNPYPWSPGHVLQGPERLDPVALHPAFHGSFDWHSCVHSHWALVRLLALHPGAPGAAAAEAVLDEDLTPRALEGELAYLQAHPEFERPYGWVWYLRLAAEARGTRWNDALAPLAGHLRSRLLEYFEGLRRPHRHGLHANTAFALTLGIDAAQAGADGELGQLCSRRALEWFGEDRDYPAHLEPLGSDFLSPALTEAALLARILQPRLFAAWFEGFLPGLPGTLLAPAAHEGDAHHQGLDLSRAWSLGRIARGLGAGDPRHGVLTAAAGDLLEAGLRHVGRGDYLADHWLATFAVLALDDEARA
jgi:hypothetical protein